MMNRFEKVSLLKNCTQQELFDFHLDTNNLVKISPPNMKVTLLNKEFNPKVGEVIKIKTIKNFIPTTWEVKIDKIQEPSLLVDIALKSPFKYWKHSHIYTKKGNAVELKDEVIYELPLGKFGQFFDFIIRKELQSMFDFRHKITKEILSQKTP